MSGIFGGPKASKPPPAIGALNVQQSCYGAPVQIVYGTNRVTGNLLWYDNFYYTVQNSGGSGGGKGGGGGGSSGGTYNYYASIAIGICEGPISGVGQVWETKNLTTLSDVGGSLFTGTQSQAPWGYLTSNYPAVALGYNNLAYVGFANLSLGTSPDTPNFAYEVQGLLISQGQDATPDAVISDFLTRSAFPPAYIGSFTACATYWLASGFFVSPVITSQKAATDWLNEWTSTLNADFVWSNGVLTLVPYGDTAITGNGATYTPNMTPVYNLADNDFIRDGDVDPVMCSRTDLADAYNQQPIEYLDRTNYYNVATYTAEDAGHIDMFGIRTAATLSAHHVTSAAEAVTMANLILWRNLYTRSTYNFKLGWKHILLDPMDYVTITDAALGLTNALVRIIEINEDANGLLDVTAEEVPGALAAPAIYASQSNSGFNSNYNSPAGSANAPIIFEPPLALLQQASVEVWLATSGDSNYGGCEVFVSNDGLTYSYLQRLNGSARQGVLTASLPSGTALDITNTLSVDMTESNGVIQASPTTNDAINLNTLSYVDGELLAFGSSTLTGTNLYNFSYLERGAYGTTISSHAINSQFARLDNQIITIPVDQKRIGQTLYIKLVAFNNYGLALQDISTVPAYSYKVTGASLLTALANPTNLSVNYTSNIAQLNWSSIVDIRTPIYYEIRQGSTFANALVIGRTTQTSFLTYGSGTYWVSALYFTPLGVAVYSTSPPSIAVSVPAITQNVLGQATENPSWSGTLTNLIVSGGVLELGAAGNILTETNVLTVTDIIFYGGENSSGTYQAPVGNRVISAYVLPMKVILNYTLLGVSINDNVLKLTNILSSTDILNTAFYARVSAQPQIRLSQNGGSTWGAWQNWIPGVYTGNALDYQIILSTNDPTVIAELSNFSMEVDVPPRTDTGTVVTSASASVPVTYTSPFNVSPPPQITIVNASAGDDVILNSITASGFSVSVINGGSNVVRTLNWSSTSY